MAFARCYAGRDWVRGPHILTAWAMLFPRRDLMTRQEEGRLTLAGLHVELTFSVCDVLGRPRPPRFGIQIRTDADEITRRIAANAGQLA
jgi:hypothetical protein